MSMTSGTLIGVERTRRPARLSLAELSEQAREASRTWAPLDLSTPVDTSRHFLCPTVTPLYYTEIHRSLTVEEKLRYNQLSGLAFNEVISFFEEMMAPVLLPAAARAARSSPELAECLARFEEEERRHLTTWRELNRWTEAELHGGKDRRFLKLPALLKAVFRDLCRRPRMFPMLFWLLAAQEELSMEVARRSLAMPGDLIEPRFAQAYRAHLADEVRHVQIDWHLIDHFHAPAGRVCRGLNAFLFREAFRHFFVTPKRLARRVVEALARDFPNLAPLVPEMLLELRGLRTCRPYQEMMYSRRNHPVLFALFDSFPEMQGIRKVLAGYEPRPKGGFE
ncbi:MAG TPA: diiron oxygenase [Planctomycetota bacterium]|nr:diiron oxygenase [Planctomycetota bacterium]